MSTTTFTLQKETLLEKIGSWFAGLFNDGIALYNSLPQADQQALVNGSGIIAIIAKNLTQPQAAVTALIQQLYPTVDPALIQGFLEQIQALKAPNETPAIGLENVVGWVQGYLLQHNSGSFLAIASTDLYTILTTLFTPETPVEKIIALGTVVYQIIIKPSEPVYTISAPPTPTAVAAPAALGDGPTEGAV